MVNQSLEEVALSNLQDSSMSYILTSRGYTNDVTVLLQCRLRGRIDTNLCTAAYLEEKFSSGLTFLLSAEVSFDILSAQPH